MCLRGTMSSCGIAGSRSRASRVPVAAALSPSVSQALSQNMAWSQKAAGTAIQAKDRNAEPIPIGSQYAFTQLSHARHYLQIIYL